MSFVLQIMLVSCVKFQTSEPAQRCKCTYVLKKKKKIIGNPTKVHHLTVYAGRPRNVENQITVYADFICFSVCVGCCLRTFVLV